MYKRAWARRQRPSSVLPAGRRAAGHFSLLTITRQLLLSAASRSNSRSPRTDNHLRPPSLRRSKPTLWSDSSISSHPARANVKRQDRDVLPVNTSSRAASCPACSCSSSAESMPGGCPRGTCIGTRSAPPASVIGSNGE